MASQVASTRPNIFIEPSSVFISPVVEKKSPPVTTSTPHTSTPHTSTSHTSTSHTSHTINSCTPHAGTNGTQSLLTAGYAERRPWKSLDDSDYGSDPVRLSAASSDNPDDAITQSFMPVFEMVKDFTSSPSRDFLLSQSSCSSSRKHSQDSLSVSSNCSDDAVSGVMDSESDSEEEGSPERKGRGSGSTSEDAQRTASPFRRPSESPEEIAQLLVGWAREEFVPCAHVVLDVCAEDRPIVLCLQSHLRQLSNTVTTLCNRLLRRQATASPTQGPGAGVEELTKSIHIAAGKPSSQLSFVVRVLSPTTTTLGPIISSMSKGFSASLYQDIVTVLQKLSWKIEACVKFESPDCDFQCHKAIFDDERRSSIERFLSVTPPIEPRLRSSTSLSLRYSTCDCQPNLIEEAEVFLPAQRQHSSSSSSATSPRKKLAAGRVLSLDPGLVQERGRAALGGPGEGPRQGEGPEEPRLLLEGALEEEEEEEAAVEEEYFRPLNMRRCQTMTLTREELTTLGIKQKRPPLEGSEIDFQAFRSYSQSFFRQPQTLSKVPKSIRQRLNKSLKRKGSFGSLMQVRSLSVEVSRDPAPQGSSPAPHPPPLAAELHVPSRPRLPLTKTTSCESLTTKQREGRSASPQGLQASAEDPRGPAQPPKSPSASSSWGLPGRFKRWSSGEKARLSTSETVKLPRERAASKSLFSIFSKRHSQHFLLEGDDPLKSPRPLIVEPDSPTLPPPSQEGEVPEVGEPTLTVVTPPKVAPPPASSGHPVHHSPLLNDNSKDEYMQISVSQASKKTKKSGSLSRDNPNAWLEISVTTNLKEYPSEENYKVFRRLPDAQRLVRGLNGVLQKTVVLEMPGKKLSAKKQRVKLETFLKEVSSSKVLRTHPAVVDFLRPDGAGPQQSGECAQVQSDWELLTTLYCPDKPGSVPGTMHGAVVYDNAQPGAGTGTELYQSPHNSLRKSTQRRSLSLRRKTLVQVTTVELLDMQTRVIREDGADVLIYQVDGQENRVIAGTFDTLVKQLAGEEKPDSYYVTTFLYGLRHFTRPSEVASKLIRRFKMQVPPNATEDERSYAIKWREIIQQRILDVLFQWMQKCWPDFERDEELVTTVKDFLFPLTQHENLNFQVQANTMLDLIDRHSLGRMTPSPTAAEVTNTDETPPTSPSFLAEFMESRVQWREILETSSTQLAKQLTLVELKCLQAIDHFELAMHIWEKKTPENICYRTNLDAYIKRFNEVSFWVGTVMCAVPEVKERSAMIEKFIMVAKHCYEYKNFNTMTALLSGLSYSAVNSRRLKKSWMGVRDKSMSLFRKLEDLVDPANNLSRYRHVLARVGKKEPCIPFFAVYLKDFTFLNDGHARFLSNGLVNFSKLRTLVMKIEEFRRFQESHYSYARDEHVYSLCLHLNCLSESQLYDASLSIEPNKSGGPVRISSSAD